MASTDAANVTTYVRGAFITPAALVTVRKDDAFPIDGLLRRWDDNADLTKYGVGVELAMQPRLVTDSGFVLPVAAAYGVFNGLFTGRAARLWRLALQPAALHTHAA